MGLFFPESTLAETMSETELWTTHNKENSTQNRNAWDVFSQRDLYLLLSTQLNLYLSHTNPLVFHITTTAPFPKHKAYATDSDFTFLQMILAKMDIQM